MEMMKEIKSNNALSEYINNARRSYLLLYKKGSYSSNCALEKISEAALEAKDALVLGADVNVTRDIHPVYRVDSVPSLLEFRDGELVNVYKGCSDTGFYKSLFEAKAFAAPSRDNEMAIKRVTVYSTPTCSWCNTLKAYLKQHNIRFTDIDVSRDPKAAEALVKRSGQTGVPQTDINGELIVGFDRERINRLLGLRG